MVTKNRKRHKAVALILKQAGVIKTLTLATAGFKNGTIKVIAYLPSKK